MEKPGKNIKLFVDAHALDKGYQGTNTFIRELYTELLAAQPDIDIYFGTACPEKMTGLFPGLNPGHILPYKHGQNALYRFAHDIPHYLKRHGFDFAHFQYMSPRPVKGCQYIVTLHDITFNDFPQEFSWLYRKSREYLFGRSIRRAAIKTTVSNYSKNRICDRYHIPAEHLHVIPNGVNFLPAGKTPDKAYAAKRIKEKFGIENFILCVSRIEPRKNHELLLDVYLELELYKRNIPLVFIGKGSVRVPSLINKITKLTGEQKSMFFWLQDIGQQDLVSFYSSCRLFVYPSKAEGFGIPPLEAAVCRAPVLCSSATAMEQFDFFRPYTFNPSGKEEFKNKLLSMINIPPSQYYLESVAKRVASRYKWAESSKLFYNLLIQ